MHEYALVQSLMSRVEAEAEARGATAVHRVAVKVGELAGVERDLFLTAFETFRSGLCAAARLELTVVPAAWSCERCGRPIARGALLACPLCGGRARLSPEADALTLETLELEVP